MKTEFCLYILLTVLISSYNEEKECQINTNSQVIVIEWYNTERLQFL